MTERYGAISRRNTTQVRTAFGDISGVVDDGLVVFKGIRYALPPTGHLRWQAPQCPEAMAETRFCNSFGASPWQMESLFNPVLGENDFGAYDDQSEDCLFLNVWTPACDRKSRPVMVWIPGGGFKFGSASNPLYDSGELARRGDLILVTLNYRLGPFGFLRLSGGDAASRLSTGNEGILDQLMALQWVQENIASFGGDPDRVTIFGESAGACSVAVLMTSPLAKGLFKQAIMQSGVARCTQTIEEANITGDAILGELRALQCDVSTPHKIPAKKLATAANIINSGQITGQSQAVPRFLPVVDNEIVVQDPLDALLGLSADHIPLLIGNNRQEWNLYGSLIMSLDAETEADIVGRISHHGNPTTAAALYQIYYELMPGASPAEVYLAYQTDRLFILQTDRICGKRSNTGNTFRYLYDYPSRAHDGTLGACHGVEVAAVFGSYRSASVEKFSGADDSVIAISRAMQDSWISFAHTGRPKSEATGSWSSYSTESPDTMVFGETIHRVTDYFDRRRGAWGSLCDSQIVGL